MTMNTKIDVCSVGVYNQENIERFWRRNEVKGVYLNQLALHNLFRRTPPTIVLDFF